MLHYLQQLDSLLHRFAGWLGEKMDTLDQDESPEDGGDKQPASTTTKSEDTSDEKTNGQSKTPGSTEASSSSTRLGDPLVAKVTLVTPPPVSSDSAPIVSGGATVVLGVSGLTPPENAG